MSNFKKFNSWFDKNSNNILWVLLAVQAIVVSIYSFMNS